MRGVSSLERTDNSVKCFADRSPYVDEPELSFLLALSDNVPDSVLEFWEPRNGHGENKSEEHVIKEARRDALWVICDKYSMVHGTIYAIIYSVAHESSS
jgi:hypothetical protein